MMGNFGEDVYCIDHLHTVPSHGKCIPEQGDETDRLSHGIGEAGLLVPFFHAIGNPTIWLGTALLLIAFLLFSAALSWADLSFVLPTVSIEVIVNVAFADYFLNEPVSAVRWIGAIFVSIGVILVMRSARQKVQEK